MPSFSDWLNANAGQEAQTLQNALTKQQGDGTGIQQAYAAGKSGGQAPPSQSTYGDFLKALSGDYQGSNAQTAAQLGMPSAFEGSLAQGAAGDQLKQAQAAYDQQQQAQQNAYAAGQRNANTAGAAQQMQAFQQSNFNAGQGHLTPEQAKQAQQDSLAAGAQYRLAKERQAYEADRANQQRAEGRIASILNPVYGATTGFGSFQPTDTSGLLGKVQDPLGLGGNAHSGFGPGGKFGSPLGMGSATGGDPFGQYDTGDAGFQQWLLKNGYDPTTGNGGGY